MKIVTWNCNMAFRKKADIILSHNPDIIVVPECECLDKLKFNVDSRKPTDKLWFGANPHKGLGIFSYSKYRFRLLDFHNPAFRTIIPVEVTGGMFDFILFAIWANNPTDPDGQYIEQVWKAIHYYDNYLNKTPVILIGDFNSNTIWDRKYRKGNHSSVVKVLESRNILSTYHLFHKQKQGREKHPTLYMYRHKDKPYHIDYCFASKDIAKRIKSVEIGEFDFWIKYSDHVPVIITFKSK